MKIDINCDLGEHLEFLENGLDVSLMKYIFSANIACGKHAGDKYLMEQTIINAKKNNLKVGAHIGYDDKENFGRFDMNLSDSDLKRLIISQLQDLSIIAETHNIKLFHVKPHGALYNQSSKNEALAHIIAQCVKEFNPKLKLMGLAGSSSIIEAKKIGLETINEAFADRMYDDDGFLSSRKIQGSVINDITKLKEQLYGLLNQHEIKSSSGKQIKIKAESICIHSDTPHALEFANVIFQFVNTYNSSH